MEAERQLYVFGIFTGNVSILRTEKKPGHVGVPRLRLELSAYGLELTDECGTAIGPAACCSSDRPMHCPELAPVHGMLSTSGSPPGEVTSGEFGTSSGVHIPVNWSSASPPGHAVIEGAEVPAVGTTKTATAGAAATATANPPASKSRAGSFKVAIITLSVVIAGSADITPGNRKPLCHRQ